LIGRWEGHAGGQGCGLLCRCHTARQQEVRTISQPPSQPSFVTELALCAHAPTPSVSATAATVKVVSHQSSPPHSLTHSRTLLYTRTQNTHMHSAVAVLCDSCVDVIASLQCGLSPECSHSHTRLPVPLASRRRTRQNVFVTALSLSHTHTSLTDATDHTSQPLIHLSSLACVYALHHLALTFITSVVSARCTLNQIAAYHIAECILHSFNSLCCVACTFASVPALLHRPLCRGE